MSCLLLKGHHIIHTIQDDMESFVHVVLYHALRYLPHNRPLDTTYIMDNIFNDQKVRRDGTYVGGHGKKAMFFEGEYIDADFRFSPGPLDSWMRWAIGVVRQWIECVAPTRVNDDEAWSSGLAHLKHTSPPTPATAVRSTAGCVLHDHNAMEEVFSAALALKWPGDDCPVDALSTAA